MNKVISYNYQEYPPTQETIGDLNSSNKDIIFEIVSGDGFMQPHNADVYMKYKLRVRDDDTQYNDNDEVRLVDNFFTHLWSQILVDKCDTIIDRTDYPGVTCTALGTCFISKAQAYKYKMCGWETDSEAIKNAKSTKEILFKLKLIGGFLNGYNDVLYKGGLKITFKRNNNDNTAVHVWNNGKPGKVVIKSMYIRVPVVKYDPLDEVKLKAELIKAPVSINFIKNQTVRKPVSGSNFEIDLTNSFIARQFDMPDWNIVLFQTDRTNANQKNYSAWFDHCKVKSMYIENGRGEVFPIPLWNLKISKNEYAKMYHAYTEISRIMMGTEEVYYTLDEFIKNRPMYLLNTSRRMRGVDNQKTTIKLVVDCEEDVADNTLCYVIMLGKKSFDYDIKNQRITEQI
jgi:hypothetical protein